MAGRKARGGKIGRRIVNTTQRGVEDGANQAAYWIAFGAALTAVYGLWEWIKRRGNRNV